MSVRFDSLMNRLRMKHIQLLLALDQHKSLHRASAAMSMTQSAASKALAEIESIVGVELFDRTRVGLVANGFGDALLRYARLLSADIEAMCHDVNRMHDGGNGVLSIGTVMGAIPALVAPAVADLYRTYPGLSVHIVEDTSAKLLDLLDAGQIDLVIGRATVSAHPYKYRYRPLADEPVSIVAGPAHIDRAGMYRDLASLVPFRWVTYPAHMPMYERLQHELRLAGLSMPAGTIATPSAFVALSLLQSGEDLVSLLPDSIVSPWAQRGRLTVLPIALQSVGEEIGIVSRLNMVSSRFADHFAALLEARRTSAGGAA